MKLTCLALLSFPICVLAEAGLPSTPYLYVEGQAEVEKAPDFVGLNFRVVGRSPDRAKANQEAQAKVLKAFAVLREAKIADSDVMAEDLYSETQYDESLQGHNKLTGYTFTRPVYVKVKDITIFAALVDQLIGLGGIEFARIEGGLSKQMDVEEEMKQQALTNARERAEKTVATMGMKIDSVFAVSPVRFPELLGKLLSSDRQVIVTGSSVPEGKERITASEYRLAPVMINQSVHVIYLISPSK